MPQFPLEYAPGVVADDTVLTRAGRFVDADKARFVRAGAGQPLRPQLIGGWERLTRDTIPGVTRSVFAWTDNAGDLNIAFGSHTKLTLWKGGETFNLTPYGPPARLGANPLASQNTLGTVTVTHTAHGYANGIGVRLYGAATFNGLDAANLNGVRTITVINANSYSFTAGAADVASATGAGGGSSIVVVPQTELPAGQINGTGGRGYGTGGYGVGGYGEPSDTDYFPRTWSFGLLGQALVASPRDGAIYIWENDTAQRATWLENSPLQNASILTTPERVVMALGTEEEASNTFNPRCIRHSDSRDETVWNTDTDTLAREKILEGAGRIVAGRGAGPGNFIWTDNELYQASYVGALEEVYRFDRLGEDCGLAGPNAGCVRNQRGYWLTPDLQFMTCGLGGEPSTIESPMRAELTEYLAASQRDKIVMTTLSRFNEVWTFYPDSRDGNGGSGVETSRALMFSVSDPWWSKAQLARTAFCDAGPADYPVGLDVDGNAYWHERGTTSDGNAISWSLEAGPQYLDGGRLAIWMRSFWPDFTDQVGPISLTIYTREYPQSTAVEHGPYVMVAGDEAVDLRIDGRIVSWKISGSAGPASWRLGTPLVEGKATRRAK